MAEILPLRPWRYNRTLDSEIDSLVSPLFDVVSEKQREALYRNPLNSIHLSVPRDSDANGAIQLFNEWRKNGIVNRDRVFGIYVYYQYFRLPGSTKVHCRKGFIAHIRVHEWKDRVILRHENTIPDAVNDRIELLEKTELHASATHGLYTDSNQELEKYMDLAITNPIYETEDYQGVSDVLAVIHDAAIIQRFIDVISPQQIILADGHHRYEGSIQYYLKQKALNAQHTGKEGYNYHLMYLTNTEGEDLQILPTHRVIRQLAGLDEKLLLAKLAEFFSIRSVEDVHTLNEVITGKQWTFGLIFPENAYKITLKPDAFPSLSWPFPDLIKKLDLTVMHYFIIEKALGIPGKQQRVSHNIDFDRSFSDCLKRVIQRDAQLAIITNEVTIEDVKRVCASGYTMPQKSTYFYPKVIGGFLFSSINQEDFKAPAYAPFQ